MEWNSGRERKENERERTWMKEEREGRRERKRRLQIGDGRGEGRETAEKHRECTVHSAQRWGNGKGKGKGGGISVCTLTHSLTTLTYPTLPFLPSYIPSTLTYHPTQSPLCRTSVLSLVCVKLFASDRGVFFS